MLHEELSEGTELQAGGSFGQHLQSHIQTCTILCILCQSSPASPLLTDHRYTRRRCFLAILPLSSGEYYGKTEM